MLVGCSTCGGSGASFAEECGSCGGTGRSSEPAQLRVNLPPGVTDGQTIRLRGQGAEGERGASNGDLLVTLRVGPHTVYERHGDDLVMHLPLTIREAMEGTRVETPTPWGAVMLTIPAGAAPGQRLRLRGRGVRRDADKGDLFVVLQPTPPDSDDPAALEAARVLDDHYAQAVREKLALE